MDSLAQGWREVYEKAQKYNAVEKFVIEEIKLQVLEDIKQKFVEMWEE